MYVIGDVHGSVAVLDSVMSDMKNDDRYVMCLGDVGLNYGAFDNAALREAMENSGHTWLVMRGNHDTRYWRDFRNKDGWNVKSVNEDGLVADILVNDDFPNIWYLSDVAGIFTYNGKKCLYVPGGFSVDGNVRIAMHYPYEYEERLTFKECNDAIQLAEMNDDIRYVFSHVAPNSWTSHFSGVLAPGLDKSRIDKSMENALDQVLENIEWHNNKCDWFFGHYHDTMRFNHNKFVTGTMLFNNVSTID